jgi:rod shape-determining protein MreC
MFSKRTVALIMVIALIAVNILLFSLSNQHLQSSDGPDRIAISLVAPFQKTVTLSVRFLKDIWRHYFLLISVSEENEDLKKSLSNARQKNNELREIALANARLRQLLDFRETLTFQVLSAEIISNDPSPWFKSVMIDKGSLDGVEQGMPVVVPEGIAGLVIDVSLRYAKVRLIIDQNSAADALIQKNRARGIIKGGSADGCYLQYVLRKQDVAIGDAVIASGLDGVYPKGLRIGRVSNIVKLDAGIFQEISVVPYVDFEDLEEVLILINTPNHKVESAL